MTENDHIWIGRMALLQMQPQTNPQQMLKKSCRRWDGLSTRSQKTMTSWI